MLTQSELDHEHNSKQILSGNVYGAGNQNHICAFNNYVFTFWRTSSCARKQLVLSLRNSTVFAIHCQFYSQISNFEGKVHF